MTKIKLSEKQKEVIRLLLKNWECATYPRTRWFDKDKTRMQEGGIGRGGKSIPIHANTIQSLYKLGLLKQDDKIRFMQHRLSKLGKTIEL